MFQKHWLNIRHKSPASVFGCVIVLVSLLGLGAQAQGQSSIYPVTTFDAYPSSESPSTFAAGDFNGDGLPDVAMISPAQGTSTVATLTILLNQGISTPPTYVSTSLNTSACLPSVLVAVDMNNDSKLDVVLVCANGYIAVLLGNGDGTFQAPAYYAISNPKALVPVDLNGDGYLDLAVTSNAANGASSLNILLNQGTAGPGILSMGQNYTALAGAPFGFVGAGDFNGDGKQDILVQTGNVGVFGVFYGNGDGTLKTLQTTSFPAGPSVTADFNHDGITDVAYVSTNVATSTSTFQVLLGSSNGLVAGSSLPLYAGLNYPTPFLVGGASGSSNLNVAVVGAFTTILLGDSSGSFTYGLSYGLGAGNYSAATEYTATGIANLVYATAYGFAVLAGNGDGTFKGSPTTYVGGNGLISADVNGDGLTDVIGASASGSSLFTALGRGNGTFSLINQSPSGGNGVLLAAGDFSGDGKIDIAQIGANSTADSLYLYLGNGNGTFQSSLPAVDLQESGSQQAVVGDFNGDGNLDIMISYVAPNYPFDGGLVFLPGKGKGTFGQPAAFSPLSNLGSIANLGLILVSDLNNDKKMDLVWNANVYLGNGDGTFKEQPLGIPGTVLAVGDLNGDGIPDLVIGVQGGSTGVYAGNGDGSFQSSPFYVVPLPNSGIAHSVSIGDVNADGNPDLAVLANSNSLSSPGQPLVLLGNGHGSFTTDTNIYYSNSATAGKLARLNNRAPDLPNDNALDYLVFANGAATSLLNQTNPAPTAPLPLQSVTALSVSANSVNIQQQLTFTAAVAGTNPTGTVSFASGSTTLGTASVVNGAATLTTSFAAAGTYTVTANYAGDSENLASTSNVVSISVAAQDFTLSASPATATIAAGQSAVTTLTVTPIAGYNGTVSFSCGTLPSKAACSFAPSSVTPTNGAAVSSKLTITTTAPSTAMSQSIPRSLQGIAWAGTVVLLLVPGRVRRLNRRWMRSALAMLLLISGLLSLSGCGSSSTSPNPPPVTPGTPAGTYTVTVSVADSANKLFHSAVFTLTVQ